MLRKAAAKSHALPTLSMESPQGLDWGSCPGVGAVDSLQGGSARAGARGVPEIEKLF